MNNSSNTTSPRVHVFPVRDWILSCYIIITCLGVVGNTLVLWVVVKRKMMKGAPFGKYVGCLALADWVVSITCVPIYLTSTSWYKHPVGAAGDAMCKVCLFYIVL